VPVDRTAVKMARAALEQLARALELRADPEPRGVALASGLLTDPCSPLYRQPDGVSRGEALHAAARQALLALGAGHDRDAIGSVS
jgi:hypothetical protein